MNNLFLTRLLGQDKLIWTLDGKKKKLKGNMMSLKGLILMITAYFEGETVRDITRTSAKSYAEFN